MAERKSRQKQTQGREVALPETWRLSEAWPFPSRVEIEERFEEMIRRRWGVLPGETPVDVIYYGREVLVELDLPGVEQESVQVRLEQGAICVEAHRPPSAPDEGAQPARLERERGLLRRRVALPRHVEGRVEFDLEAGVLRVRVRPENHE